MFKSLTAMAVACGISALVGGTAIAATITDVSGNATYSDVVPRDPGVYGLELRGGNGATNGDWEIGVGSHTSVSGSFTQGQYAWDGSLTPVSFSYDYGVGAANTASFTIGGQTFSHAFGTLEFGNTIRIFAKRSAEIMIDSINGSALASAVTVTGNPSNAWDPNATKLLSSQQFQGGFTLAGTLFVQPGSGSANEIFIAAGNIDVAPVPLPAAAWLLLAGVGGLGVMARRKRAAA